MIRYYLANDNSVGGVMAKRLMLVLCALAIVGIAYADSPRYPIEPRAVSQNVAEEASQFFGSTPAAVAQRCCKICRKGKACGNSCISRSKTCRKPPGCACNAR